MTSPADAYNELMRLHNLAVEAWVAYAESIAGTAPATNFRGLQQAARQADREFQEALMRLFDQPARLE